MEQCHPIAKTGKWMRLTGLNRYKIQSMAAPTCLPTTHEAYFHQYTVLVKADF